jgi:DNA-binding NarL/FixJ family response regulator
MQVFQIGPKTSVSVISDSRLFRETICSWLKRHQDIQCVAAAGGLQHLRQRPEVRAAEVLLVRARIDGVLGRELAYEMRTLLPSMRLIVVQSHDGEHDLVRWIEAGAVDYLHHSASPAELLQSIRDSARGCPRCSMSLHTRVIRASSETTYKVVHLEGSSGTAKPVLVRELDSALRLQLSLTYKATAGQSGIKAARNYDSSKVPIR